MQLLAVGVAGLGLEDAGDDVALDEAALLLGGLAEDDGGEAVDVAHGASGGFVQEGRSVGGEELAVAAVATEAHAEVLGGVVGGEGVDGDAVVEAA